jgi:hypothetical protein
MIFCIVHHTLHPWGQVWSISNSPTPAVRVGKSPCPRYYGFSPHSASVSNSFTKHRYMSKRAYTVGRMIFLEHRAEDNEEGMKTPDGYTQGGSSPQLTICPHLYGNTTGTVQDEYRISTGFSKALLTIPLASPYHSPGNTCLMTAISPCRSAIMVPRPRRSENRYCHTLQLDRTNSGWQPARNNR